MLYSNSEESNMGLGFNYKKTVQMSNYLVSRLGALYKTKLIKLIFLADRLHFRTYGRTITGDSYQAQQHGPVTLKTYNLIHTVADDEDEGVNVAYFKKFLNIHIPFFSRSKREISSKKEFDAKILSKTDLEILDRVIEKFGGMSREELIEYTHQLPEWKDLYKKNEEWKEIELAQFINKSLDKSDEASDYAKDLILN